MCFHNAYIGFAPRLSLLSLGRLLTCRKLKYPLSYVLPVLPGVCAEGTGLGNHARSIWLKIVHNNCRPFGNG